MTAIVVHSHIIYVWVLFIEYISKTMYGLF